MLPTHRVLLFVRNIVPGFQVLVGHHESAGKSTLDNCCFPYLSSSSNCIRRGGSPDAFTFQYVVTCIKGCKILNELGGATLYPTRRIPALELASYEKSTFSGCVTCCGVTRTKEQKSSGSCGRTSSPCCTGENGEMPGEGSPLFRRRYPSCAATTP